MTLIQEGVNSQKVILMQVFLLLDLPDILPYFINTVSPLFFFQINFFLYPSFCWQLLSIEYGDKSREKI